MNLLREESVFVCRKGKVMIVYEIGELVQYGNSGICKIEGIVQGVAGLDKDTKYYLMIPINCTSSKIYSPIDNDKVKMRNILSEQEAEKLFNAAPEITELSIINEKQCEGIYKEALYSIDCYRWLMLLKTLCARKILRARQGKKITATDERYLKSVEERLKEELCVIMGEEKAKQELEHAVDVFAQQEA